MLSKKKYRIILADPPWGYRNPPSKKGTTRIFAKNKYDLMSIEEISNLPIENISDKNSVLFLWVTLPMLKEGLKVLSKWGFKYRTTAFVWIKNNKKTDSFFWGGGYYTRSNVELVLLGTKGKILQRKSRRIHQIINTRIEEHSKKPNEVREKIIELFGDLPRIELFAREKTKGWDVWGNEIKSKIKLRTTKVQER